MFKKYKKQILEIIDDYSVTCPKCGKSGLQYEHSYWQCLWRDCSHKIFDLPSSRYFAKLSQLEEDLECLKKLQKIRKEGYDRTPGKDKYKKFRDSLKIKRSVCD